MIKVGIACRKISQSKKDGIGIYSQELLHAFHTIQGIKAYPYCLDLSLKNLARNYLFNRPFPTVSRTPNDLNLLHVTDYLIPKSGNIPVIATLHDAVPLQYPQWVRKQWRTFKNTFLRYSVKHLSHVISLSHAVVPDLINFWKINPDKISVVHPGVNPLWFKELSLAEKESTLKKYDIQKKYFLFVGTFQPRKNLFRILSAYLSLPEEIKQTYSLILIGQAGWKNEDCLKLLQNSNTIKWLQYVPQEDINCLYQSAELFIFPSLYEGFGMPILEAFASNIPVITSDLSAMPEVAGNCALLVNPYCIDAIKDAILKIISDASLKNKLISSGKERAKEFTWDKCAQQLLKVYTHYT